jgi:hypothetical protein
MYFLLAVFRSLQDLKTACSLSIIRFNQSCFMLFVTVNIPSSKLLFGFSLRSTHEVVRLVTLLKHLNLCLYWCSISIILSLKVNRKKRRRHHHKYNQNINNNTEQRRDKTPTPIGRSSWNQSLNATTMRHKLCIMR